MVGYRKWLKRVLWLTWRSWIVKALFQDAKRCTNGAALFRRAGRCDESFDVEIPISGDGGGNRFLP